MMRVFIRCWCLALCVRWCLASDAVASSDETRALAANWHELQARHLRLLPVPKRIRFTGAPVVIAGPGARPLAIVTNSADDQARIAVDEIATRIEELAPGTSVAVGSAAPAGAYVVILDAAWPGGCAGVLGTAAGTKDGEQTYALQPSGDGIHLAGQGAIGRLYAAVTLRWLIERDGDRVVLHPASVVDWPDFLHRYTPELGQHTIPGYNSAFPHDPVQAFAYMKPLLDHLFRIKASGIATHTFSTWHMVSPFIDQARVDPKVLAAAKQISDYALARGLPSFQFGKVSLGEDWSDKDNPEVSEMLHYQVHEEYHSWARHDLHRKKAEQYAALCRAGGFTQFYIHSIDGGSLDNPELWSERDALTRQRYGDDRVAADADMFSIYIDIFRKVGVAPWLVVYPYTGDFLDEDAGLGFLGLADTPEQRAYVRKAIAANQAWMRGIHARLPHEVPVCLREGGGRTSMRAFRSQFPGRPVFLYYEVSNALSDTRPLLPPEIATFTSAYEPGHGDDILWCNMYGAGENVLAESTFAAVMEYAWNTNFPGVHELARSAKDDPLVYDQTAQQILAERAAVGMWGDEAGQFMKELFSRNLSFVAAYDPRKATEQMHVNFKEHAKLAAATSAACERAVAALDALWARCKAARASGRRLMDATSYPYFVQYYGQATAARVFATVNLGLERAMAQLRSGDLPGATAEIAAARSACVAGTAAYEVLMRELSGEPRVVDFDALHRWLQGFSAVRLLKPDFAALAKRIDELDAGKEAIFQQFNVPAWFTQELAHQTLSAMRADAAMAVDGVLDEAVWTKAPPIEHFVAWKALKHVGSGVVARFAFDDQNLYLGFSARQPLTGKIHEPARGLADYAFTEGIELFLQSDRKGLCQIAVDTAGNVFTSLRQGGEVAGKEIAGVDLGVRAATQRTDSGWSAEVAIPFAKLGAKPGPEWRAMLVYNQLKSLEPREIENVACAFFDGRLYRDTEVYLPLAFVADPPATVIPPSDLSIASSAMDARTHATGAGSFVTFAPRFETRRPLYDVIITARLFDADRKQVYEGIVQRAPFVPLVWAPSGPVQQQLEKVYPALRLELTAEYRTVDGGAGRRTCTAVLGDASALIRPEDVFAAGAVPGAAGLAVPCHFDAAVNGTPLLTLERGTIEFWVKAAWEVKEPETAWRGSASRVLFFYGPLRPGEPQQSNRHCLVVYQDRQWDKLGFRIASESFQSRGVSADIAGWAKDSWHHVAAVWDLGSGGTARMEIYLDGKRASGPVGNWGTPDDSALPIATAAYAVQIGAMNSGELPAQTVLQELRIATLPLHAGDFAPQHQAKPDASAEGLFFSFDRTLEGAYVLRGNPGSLHARVGFLAK